MKTYSRLLFVCLMLLGLPLFGASQWDSLRELAPGDRVVVRDTSGKSTDGKFTAYTPAAISIETKQGAIAIEKSQVQRVQVRSGNRRVRNAVIGAAIGLAVAVAVDQSLGTRLRNESGDGGRPITYGASIGGFAALGGAFPAYRTVYQVK